MRNWKTTLCGVTLVLTGVFLLIRDKSNATTALAIITAGLGLIAAKDGSTHSTADQVIAASNKENQKEENQAHAD